MADEVLEAEETEDPELMARMEDLLRRAAMMRLLAQGFFYPEPGHREGLAQLMASMQPVMPGVEEPFALFKERWESADVESLESDHIRLFQAKNVVSLHETSYGDARRIGGQVVELSDLNGFYRAFNMQVSELNPEMPDHLCTELEFYSWLLLKQAYALDNGWTEEASITGDAAGKFLEIHLGRWLAPMLTGLREQGAETVYVLLGELLERVVGEECRRLEVVPQPFSGPVLLDDMH
ncbi:MAG: molecular chaperone TorD family protein, partial [Magnetococcales bacterium]|nr:molecular chaperone TorD family protein [Magnetococcales bacterium]